MYSLKHLKNKIKDNTLLVERKTKFINWFGQKYNVINMPKYLHKSQTQTTNEQQSIYKAWTQKTSSNNKKCITASIKDKTIKLI